MDLESLVLNYLKDNTRGYTQTMYKALHVKRLENLSLNQFRAFLRKLRKDGKISWDYRDTDCDLTYWTLKKD